MRHRGREPERGIAAGPGTARRAAARRRPRRISGRAFWLLLAGVIFTASVKMARPIRTILHQREQLAQLQAEKAGLEARTRSLKAYQRTLASERGLEQVARREGYLKAGERRLVFVPERGQPSGRVTSPAGAGR